MYAEGWGGAAGLQQQHLPRGENDGRLSSIFDEEEEEEEEDAVEVEKLKGRSRTVGRAGQRQEATCDRSRRKGGRTAAGATEAETAEEEQATGVSDGGEDIAAEQEEAANPDDPNIWTGTAAEDGEEDEGLFNVEEEDAAAAAGDAAAAAARAGEKKPVRRGGGGRSRRFDVGTFQGAAAAGGETSSATHFSAAAGAGGAAAGVDGAAGEAEGFWETPKQGEEEERDGLFDIYCRLNYLRTHKKEFKTAVRGSCRNQEIDELHRKVETLRQQLAARQREGRTTAAAAAGAPPHHLSSSSGRRGEEHRRGHEEFAGAAAGTGSTVSASSRASSASLRVAAVELQLQRRRLARLRAERSVDLRDDLNLLLQSIDEQLLQLLPSGDSLELRAQKLDTFSWKTPMWIGYRPLLLLKHKEDYYSRWLQHACPDPPHTLLRLLREEKKKKQQQEREADDYDGEGENERQDGSAAAADAAHAEGSGRAAERATAAAAAEAAAAEEGEEAKTAAADGRDHGKAAGTGQQHTETAAAAQKLQQHRKRQMDDEDFYVDGDDIYEAEGAFFPFDERQFEEEEAKMNPALKQQGRRRSSSLAEVGHTSEAPQKAMPQTAGSANCCNTEEIISSVGGEGKPQDTSERDLQILEEKRKAAIAKREERRRQRLQQ